MYGRFGFGPATAMAQLSELTDETAFRNHMVAMYSCSS
jgi:hypothetical protein